MTHHSNVIFKVKYFEELSYIFSKSGWHYWAVQDAACFMFKYFFIPALAIFNMQMALLMVTDGNVNPWYFL